MSKKDIKDMFSIDIDSHLGSEESSDKFNYDDINELLELGNNLSNNDFSKKSNKEDVYSKTLKIVNKNKGDIKMKKSIKSRILNVKVAAIAAGVIVTGSLSQTAFGQSIVAKVIETMSLDNVKVEQVEPSNIKSMPVPKELEGKIFDENGNEIKEFTRDSRGPFYTANGEVIEMTETMETGKVTTEAEYEKAKENEYLIVKDQKELNKYTSFDVKLPSYLPKGYEFEKAEFYKENGTVKNTDYISLYFTNKETGKYIYMQQRKASKETGYETGTEGKIEKIKVNGVDALVYDNIIDWEYNGVIYGMHGRGGVSNNDLVKIAESIK